MRKAAATILAMFLTISMGIVFPGAHDPPNADGKSAQKRLLEGNRRFASSGPRHPNQNASRRVEVAKGQRPFAAVLTCSDSRVPPEILFDQGLGDLFVIRVAGNIAGEAALGSLEYAVEHFGVRYILVLGHERCGAVEATLKGGQVPGHIAGIVRALQPAVDQVAGKPGDAVDGAVRANISLVVQQLRTSGPILAPLVKKGDLTVAGSRYDLDDGTVEMIP